MQPDIVGYNALGADETLGKVEIGLRSGGKRDFNFLVAKLDELLEVYPLLLAVLAQLADVVDFKTKKYHGVHERLVAIAQVSGQPARRLVDCLAGP